VEIAIISDTHLPKGDRRLPDGCVAALRRADLIVHAGDLAQLSVLSELRHLGEVVAVHGNVDDQALTTVLPDARTVQAGGARIGVLHDAGAAADAAVFGHSHIPLHERAADGFQIFNPGSPTERRRAPRHTMGIARVVQGAVAFELIPLD